MTEALLIIFAAVLIYYVAIKVAPQRMLFRLKKEEKSLDKKIKNNILDEKSEETKKLIEKGQEHFSRGYLKEAEKLFLEALKSDPKQPDPYHFLGIIYLRQEEYKGAEEVLKKAVELNPLNDTAFNNLGLALYNQKKYQDAIDFFEKSIQLNDKIAHRFVNLGLAFQGLKEFEKAAIAFENAAKIHENSENLQLLAKNYLKLKDRKLAISALERLLKIDPKNQWAKRNLAALENNSQ